MMTIVAFILVSVFCHSRVCAGSFDLAFFACRRPRTTCSTGLRVTTAAGGMRMRGRLLRERRLRCSMRTGPGIVSHVWVTIASDDPHHLKALVLRMYWDGEATPSVEAPIGDFFGLGLGRLSPLSVDSAAGWVGQGSELLFPDAVSEACAHHRDQRRRDQDRRLLFQYRLPRLQQALPADHFTFTRSTGRPLRRRERRISGPRMATWTDKKNLNGEGNYVWMEATGTRPLRRRDHVGAAESGQVVGRGRRHVLRRWREAAVDQRHRLGGLFPGSVGFRRASVFLWTVWRAGRGQEVAGGRSSVYRFHLDSPIPFTKSLRATIEHGHANHRSDNFFSVAYWYQSEPHAAFPALPALEQRIPRIYAVGGPGNAR